ncbi:hypothetical protein [Nannocystis sp. SCPEA4]|uniref:hypothetical protein n=1 Tax=Nannocystis sp. SCPEA4 TaxID=2996787 RepID=UPI00226DBC66|nr:hypothetical protein [Nannocystis sp. SCPEA4]MCY1059632.1 hypothetical protein [Nannocystis sp. SCPEA4]
MPVEAWPSDPTALGSPWSSFVRAREALAAGRRAEAIGIWREIADTPGLESRHHAQAWHFLRAQGVHPPGERSKVLLGVVIEVGLDGGLDLLAAYPDCTARYYNFSGAGVVWERPDDSLDSPIDALLAGGRRILEAVGVWEGPRPPAPPTGQVRIDLVSPAGLHFGQAPYQALAADPLAQPTMRAALALMQALVARSPRRGH